MSGDPITARRDLSGVQLWVQRRSYSLNFPTANRFACFSQMLGIPIDIEAPSEIRHGILRWQAL